MEQLDYIYEKLAKIEAELREGELGNTLNDFVNIGFKRLDPKAVAPSKKRNTDAGWDLYALEDTFLIPNEQKIISTGIAIELPQYHHAFIWDRSSMGVKGIKVLGGLIDNEYRGECKVILINLTKEQIEIKSGDKIAQLVIVELPMTTMSEQTELSPSNRGELGFGSSGR